MISAESAVSRQARWRGSLRESGHGGVRPRAGSYEEAGGAGPAERLGRPGQPRSAHDRRAISGPL